MNDPLPQDPSNKQSATSDLLTHTEGTVSFTYDSSKVFFNPTQVFNRDISLLVVDQYLRHIYDSSGSQRAILVDCLSASGLRALRYSRELHADIPLHILAIDISPAATNAIAMNHRDNPVTLPNVTFEVSCMDANRKLQDLHHSQTPVAIVDIDPYGHPTPFLPATLEACSHNSLLCITATDGAITCRKQCKECFIRYDAAPATGKVWAHEGSIRIVLGAIAKEAARRRASITPLISFFHKHYLRVFVLVNKKNKCRSLDMYQALGTVYHCMVCSYFTIQQADSDKFALPLADESKCPYCLSCMHISGPMWLGDLHDKEFLDRLEEALPSYRDLRSHNDIAAHISFAKGECGLPPLLYSANTITSYLKSLSLSTAHLATALEQLGYIVGPSHTQPGGLKTNAPFSAILGVLYPWHRVCVLQGSSKPVQNLQQGNVTPVYLNDSVLNKLLERYFSLDESSKRALISRYKDGMDQFYMQHHHATVDSICAIDYFSVSQHVQQWFHKSWKTDDGLTKYRATNFRPNPEPNWGPKKAK